MPETAMELGSQRESEVLQRAFRIRLNETNGAQERADETLLASVAQVSSNSFNGAPPDRHGLCHSL